MADVDEDYKIPSGNWMARRLRLINGNSAELFPPKTVCSSRSYKKYDTIYKIEFKDEDKKHEYQKHFEPKRETVQDIMFSGGLDTAQMFMNWKIPARILETPSPGRSVSAVPRIPEQQQEPDRLIRQSTLPEIPLSNRNVMRPASQARRTPSRALGTPANSARSFKPTPARAIDIWNTQVKATDSTKKTIEKVLRTNGYENQITSKLRKSLEPEARTLVDTWLNNASDVDRRMALKFFATLDNNNLPETEKQVRIDGIIKILKSKQEIGKSTPDLNTRLKYLRLQEPETRAKRWMHTTWHHLPPYRDIDPVANTSSHYTKPHQPIPHDFVIHPDWG
ncbi:hypothetical protein SNE40_000789 [Patella caerulea]|uniref:Uncharacterized protein n=1 Tax=Patella caerulea TaxID=87958 RepID=A0AAN8KEK1_PATCE